MPDSASLVNPVQENKQIHLLDSTNLWFGLVTQMQQKDFTERGVWKFYYLSSGRMIYDTIILKVEV